MTSTLRSPHISIRDEWLAQLKEEIISPALPIIDPHHHLWDRRGNRYVVDELRADLQSGHHIVATMFMQCRCLYRQDAEACLQPIGEVEFVNRIAAQFASGAYGPQRGCAGIIGYADLRLGASVETVLQQLLLAGGGRLKGIRNTTAWHPHPEVISNPMPPHALTHSGYRE